MHLVHLHRVIGFRLFRLLLLALFYRRSLGDVVRQRLSIRCVLQSDELHAAVPGIYAPCLPPSRLRHLSSFSSCLSSIAHISVHREQREGKPTSSAAEVAASSKTSDFRFLLFFSFSVDTGAGASAGASAGLLAGGAGAAICFESGGSDVKGDMRQGVPRGVVLAPVPCERGDAQARAAPPRASPAYVPPRVDCGAPPRPPCEATERELRQERATGRRTFGPLYRPR